MQNQLLPVIVALIILHDYVDGQSAGGQAAATSQPGPDSKGTNWSVELSQVTTLAPISDIKRSASQATSVNHPHRNHQPVHGGSSQETIFDDYASDSALPPQADRSLASQHDQFVASKPSASGGANLDPSNKLSGSPTNKWIPYQATEPTSVGVGGGDYYLETSNPQQEYLQNPNELPLAHSDQLIMDSLDQIGPATIHRPQQTTTTSYMSLDSMSKYLDHNRPSSSGAAAAAAAIGPQVQFTRDNPLISRELLRKALEIHESLMMTKQNSTSAAKRNTRAGHFKIFAHSGLQNNQSNEQRAAKKSTRPLQRASKLRDELLVDSYAVEQSPRFWVSKAIAQHHHQQLKHQPPPPVALMDPLESRQTELIREQLARENLPYSSLPIYFASSIPAAAAAATNEAKRLDLVTGDQQQQQPLLLGENFYPTSRSYQPAASHHHASHHLAAFNELPASASYGIYHSEFPPHGLHHHHHKTAISARSEKGLLKPILVGIAASLVSFLIISNLFLSIPLFAITLWQLCNGGLMGGIPSNMMNNMMPPNGNQQPNSNNQNQNGAQMSAQLAGKRRRRRRRQALDDGGEFRLHYQLPTGDMVADVLHHNWIPTQLSWLKQ